jgi:hypothetical protein
MIGIVMFFFLSFNFLTPLPPTEFVFHTAPWLSGIRKPVTMTEAIFVKLCFHILVMWMFLCFWTLYMN